MRYMGFLFGITFLLLNFTACAAQPQVSSGANPDYTSIKKMVVDMLKTDEGKQALKDTLTSEEFKKELVIDNSVVKQAIVDTMTSSQGKAFWTSLVEDPKFSTKLAKTMESENKTILQQLMKDPTYQSSMMSILKTPSMEQNYLDLMKTKPFREQMQKAIIETMQSPLFTTQLEDTLKKVVQSEMQKGTQSKSSSSSGGQKSTS